MAKKTGGKRWKMEDGQDGSGRDRALREGLVGEGGGGRIPHPPRQNELKIGKRKGVPPHFLPEEEVAVWTTTPPPGRSGPVGGIFSGSDEWQFLTIRRRKPIPHHSGSATQTTHNRQRRGGHHRGSAGRGDSGCVTCMRKGGMWERDRCSGKGHQRACGWEVG